MDDALLRLCVSLDLDSHHGEGHSPLRQIILTRTQCGLPEQGFGPIRAEMWAGTSAGHRSAAKAGRRC